MVKNKRGWIRVVEAVMAILLMMSLLFIFFNNYESSEDKVRIATERKETELLKEIELNQTLRNDILSASSLPLTSNLNAFPQVLRNYSRDNLLEENCVLQICLPEDPCSLDSQVMEEFKGEIYLKNIIVHSNQTLHSPKRLSMACSNDGLLSDYFPACDDGLMNGDEMGIDCGGPVCNECLYCISTATGDMNGEVTFDCEGRSASNCASLKFCNWVDPNCERKTCGEIDSDECVKGNGCVAVEKL